MSLLARWLSSPPPDAAVEITGERVAAASMGSRGGRFAIDAYAVEALPAGAVVPSLTTPNITDSAAVNRAVKTVLGRLGTRVGRVALVIPDVSTKVSLVRFEKVPERRDDLEQLVRWQIRKSAPFAIEDACISYSPGAVQEGGTDFIVALARQDVIQQYEGIFTDAGLHAGLIDLSTFSVVNLFLAAGDRPAGDWLVVHMRPYYSSIAILRGENVIFFRNRPEGDEESLADLVHQTTMYYQDRLAGQGFARVLLGGSGRAPGAVDHVRRGLEERLGAPVQPIDPTKVASLNDRIGVTTDLMDLLAPLAGMLVRTHREAAVA
jgi:type IV pilus assembly protein PilM